MPNPVETAHGMRKLGVAVNATGGISEVGVLPLSRRYKGIVKIVTTRKSALGAEFALLARDYIAFRREGETSRCATSHLKAF